MSAEQVGKAEGSRHPGVRKGVGLGSRKLRATAEATVVGFDVQRGTEGRGLGPPVACGFDPVERQGVKGTLSARA